MFVDTPGIFKPKRRLDRAMVTSAWGGAGDADVVALLLDARKGIDEEARSDPRQAARGETAQDPDPQQDRPDRAFAPAGACRGGEREGQLRRHVHDLGAEGRRPRQAEGAISPRRCPKGPWLYPEDQISDAPLRMLAAEITREKIYERLHEELPYQSTVETDQWQQRPDGSIRIEQTVFVERDSQRKIVLGKGGQTIKAIGQIGPQGDRRDRRGACASLPVREGARELGRRSRALSRNGPGISSRGVVFSRGGQGQLLARAPGKEKSKAFALLNCLLANFIPGVLMPSPVVAHEDVVPPETRTVSPDLCRFWRLAFSS